MAITASRYTLGMDREVGRETAASRGRASLMRKGMRQAKREKDYDKALGFAAGLEREGQAYGMTGNAADTSAISQGRVASRDALANQMRSQLPAMAGRSREENIAAAKSAGTFNATREQFNTANAGKKVMDEAGNIADAPPAGTTTSPKVDVPSTNTPTPPAASVKPAGTTTPANNAARVSLTDQLISGASKPQNKVPMRPSESGSPASPPEAPAKRKSAIMDNGVDVSEGIRKGLAGDRTGEFYTGKKSDAGPDMADSAIRSATALASAAKGIDATQAVIDAAQAVIDKTPKIPKSVVASSGAQPSETFTPEQKNRYNEAMRANEAAKVTLGTTFAGNRKAPEIAAREKGGPVTAGKPYLVGEKGPEIVVPEEDGEVIPNKDLKKKKARKALQAALSKK